MNNGSAFAGYTGYVQPNAPGNVGALGITFADLLGCLVMLFGRYLPIVVALAVAGGLAGQRTFSPASARCAPTRPASLAAIGAILRTTLLTFIPGLMLGPLGQGLTDRLL